MWTGPSHTNQELWPWNYESSTEIFKSHLKILLKLCSVKSSVKSHVTIPSTKCYFNESLFTQYPHTWWNIINQRLWDFEMPWSPNFAWSPNFIFRPFQQWECWKCTGHRPSFIVCEKWPLAMSREIVEQNRSKNPRVSKSNQYMLWSLGFSLLIRSIFHGFS